MGKKNFYQRCAIFLCEQTGLAPEKEAELAYAMEILLINTINLFSTLLVGGLLGVLPGTVSCVAVAAAYRHTAGGAHSKSPWRCAVATMTIFPLLAYTSAIIVSMPDIYAIFIAAIASVIGMFAVYWYAPVDSEEAPIISEDRRYRLKMYSYMVIVILIVVMAVLYLNSSLWSYAREIQICFGLTILWVSFNLTKTAKTIWSLIDRLG